MSISSAARRRLGRLALVGLVSVIAVTVSERTSASDAVERAPVPSAYAYASGRYRLPYNNLAAVYVSRDYYSHTPVGSLDMRFKDGSQVVAAASGTIRAIVDHHTVEGCTDSSTVVGKCSDYNNYVWIQHSNGEWSKYSHLKTNSVKSRGWRVGSRISAGQVVGLQGNVGASHGSHLHFEVAIPWDSTDLTPWYSDKGGFIQGTRVIPRFCNVWGNTYVVQSGRTYYPVPC
jgi:murein DD-endopeptidase MepM/ murein hydrolase activator NlpD